jgi:hypothetical protein
LAANTTKSSANKNLDFPKGAFICDLTMSSVAASVEIKCTEEARKSIYWVPTYEWI